MKPREFKEIVTLENSHIHLFLRVKFSFEQFRKLQLKD